MFIFTVIMKLRKVYYNLFFKSCCSVFQDVTLPLFLVAEIPLDYIVVSLSCICKRGSNSVPKQCVYFSINIPLKLDLISEM